MAQTRKPKPKAAQESPYKCRDCRHSYDWQNRSFNDGHLILCRCKLDKKSEFGKWCKFLSDPACSQFIKREDSDNGKKE